MYKYIKQIEISICLEKNYIGLSTLTSHIILIEIFILTIIFTIEDNSKLN